MQRKAVLLASYGATHADARRRGIDEVARDVARAFPDARLVQAFASDKIRSVLECRGEHVPSVADALSSLENEGCTEVVVLPALVAGGKTHDAILSACHGFVDSFERLAVATPLIYDRRDAAEVARVLAGRLPARAGAACALVGHGSGKESDRSLDLLRAAFAELRRDDIHVAALHQRGGCASLMGRMSTQTREVCLAPLLLSAGSHMREDLFGSDSASWVSQLRAGGFGVTCIEEGLAGLPAVRRLFLKHVFECL